MSLFTLDKIELNAIDMEPVKRNMLDHRIHSIFIEQLKKEFKDDIALVAGKLDEWIRGNSIKEVRFLVRQEILKAKTPRDHR